MNKLLILLVFLSSNCFSKPSWEKLTFYYSGTLDCFINEKDQTCNDAKIEKLLQKEGTKINHEETFIEVNKEDNDLVLVKNKHKSSIYDYVYCIYASYGSADEPHWINTYENYLGDKDTVSINVGRKFKDYEDFLDWSTEIEDRAELRKHIRTAKSKKKEPWKYTEISYKDGTEQSFQNNIIECFGYPDYCTINCSEQKEIMTLIRTMWVKEDNLINAPHVVKIWTHPQIHNKAVISFFRDAREDFYDWAVKKNGEWNIVEDAWPDNYLNKMGQQKRIDKCKKWGINPDWDFGDMGKIQPASYEEYDTTPIVVNIMPPEFTDKEKQAYILGKHDEHCYIICMMLADDKKWLRDYRNENKPSANNLLENEIKKTKKELGMIDEDYYIGLVKQAEQGAKDNDCDCSKFEEKNENKKESH